jgi:hypothetical protein
MKKSVLLLIAGCLSIILLGCSISFNVTTANITDAHMTSNVDKDGKPVDTVTEYAADAPQFVVSAVLNNAPDNTKLNFVWNYLTEKQKITEIPFDSQDNSGVYIFCNLTNDKPWPKGDYNVEIYVDTRDKPDATVAFSVK